MIPEVYEGAAYLIDSCADEFACTAITTAIMEPALHGMPWITDNPDDLDALDTEHQAFFAAWFKPKWAEWYLPWWPAAPEGEDEARILALLWCALLAQEGMWP